MPRICKNRRFGSPGFGLAIGCTTTKYVSRLQSGTPFYRPQQLREVRDRLASSFGAARPFLVPVPTYAGGMLALITAGESHEALCPPTGTLRERFQRAEPRTLYYTPEVHRAAFTLPPMLEPVPA